MICLTFDTDYLGPDALHAFLEKFPFPGAGTFFLWADAPGVDWGEHELGPHPFFTDGASNREVLARAEAFLGGAGPFERCGIRPHSCHYSHALGVEFRRRGYLYTSTQSILHQDGLCPMRQPWGLWEMPIYYMDNLDFTLPEGWPDWRHRPFSPDIIERALAGDSLYLFDFHPLHIMLNTGTRRQYAGVKEAVLAGVKSPLDLAFSGHGTRTFFEALLSRMLERGMRSFTCRDALHFHADPE